MALVNRFMFILLFVITNLWFTSAYTDPKDVFALGSLYNALGSPKELTGWRLAGGDPCDTESWLGVSCSGSWVESINIRGLGLHGLLPSADLAAFMTLKDLDLSDNSIGGFIPDALPPNATHIDLSVNKLVRTFPTPMYSLKHLNYLNISHNLLIGDLGDVFTYMHNLEQLDLSFNHFSGGLPSSFTTLTNLHKLHLEDNQFTGSVHFLANLPLSVLHVENNRFSGLIPRQFMSIPELRIIGNRFQSGDAPKVETPTPNDKYFIPLPIIRGPLPAAQNISPSPEAIIPGPEAGVSLEGHKSTQKGLGTGALAGIISGSVVFIIVVVAVVIWFRRRIGRDEIIDMV